MNHMDFFNKIKTEIQSSYVFIGEEEFVKNKALNDLKELCVGDGNEFFNVSILNEDASVIDLYEACETLPFMCEKRFVVLKNPKAFLTEMSESDLKLIESTLKDMHEYVCLVIYLNSIDKRKKLYKLFKEHSTIVEFNRLDEFEAVRWVRSTLKKQGIDINTNDAEILVNMVGVNLLDLNNEVNKLITFIGDRKVVTANDFDIIKASNINFNVFNMIDSFLSGNREKGIGQYYKLMLSGVSGFMIIGALASKYRSYYNAKTMLDSGVSKATVIKELGGNYGAKKTVEQCGKLSFDQIKKTVDALQYADYAIKNGLMKEKIATEYVIYNAF